MTRWHEDDLVGRLLAEEKRGGQQLGKLIMPMVDDAGAFTDADGPILWPEIVTREFCNDLRRHDRVFQSLYQQRPTAPGGNIFKKGWFRLYINRPWIGANGLLSTYFDEIVISVDATFKDLESSDLVQCRCGGGAGRTATSWTAFRIGWASRAPSLR
jgi:hypothetical protein